jgi:hypothetical protein
VCCRRRRFVCFLGRRRIWQRARAQRQMDLGDEDAIMAELRSIPQCRLGGLLGHSLCTYGEPRWNPERFWLAYGGAHKCMGLIPDRYVPREREDIAAGHERILVWFGSYGVCIRVIKCAEKYISSISQALHLLHVMRVQASSVMSDELNITLLSLSLPINLQASRDCITRNPEQNKAAAAYEQNRA